jgi:uncharacterized protein (TIGR00156 family)
VSALGTGGFPGEFGGPGHVKKLRWRVHQMRIVPIFGVLASAVLLSLAAAASGQYYGPGSGPVGNTVAAARELPDDAPVVLEGYIIRQLRREHYVFRDATGEIQVEIDDKKWVGRRVGPETKVRIIGEMDRKMFRSNEIEVKQIEVLATGSAPAGAETQPTK